MSTTEALGAITVMGNAMPFVIKIALIALGLTFILGFFLPFLFDDSIMREVKNG